MKDKIKNIILLILSVVISLILFELLLHSPLNVFNEYFDFWMFPNRIFYLNEARDKIYFDKVKSVDFDNIDILTIQYDIIPRFVDKKKDSEFKILFVGDSVTYGYGIENPKSIFTHLFEEKLNQYYNKKIDVINLAFGGYQLADINILLKTQTPDYDPDLIVYGYFQNDLRCSFFIPTYLPYLKYRYSSNPIDRLRTIYFLRDRLQKIRDIIAIKFPQFDCKIDKNTADKKLDEMFDFIKNGNISFYIINFPYINQNFTSDDYINTYCKINNCNYLDLREEFINQKIPFQQIRGIWEGHQEGDPVHYNYKGHELIADIFFDYFVQKNISSHPKLTKVVNNENSS